MRDISIGFFGESGAGKTSIIKNMPSIIDGMPVFQKTGIIRYLFQINSKKYTNPEKLLLENAEDLRTLTGENLYIKIQQIYETYLKSQLQLLNDFSTEAFNILREPQIVRSYILFDRSPVDFYALTICGLEYLKNKLNNTRVDDFVATYVKYIKSTAQHNTNLLFDKVVVVPAWNSTKKSLEDGVRDQYLTEFYTGENWYERLGDVLLKNTAVYKLNGDNSTLESRISEVLRVLRNR
jgi:hypothetical protein